jgi:hypothetical protein
MIKTILAPFRAVMRFPLVQFAAVIFVIFLLQAADDNSIFGRVFEGLDKLTDQTVRWASAVFTVKSFTKSWLGTRDAVRTASEPFLTPEASKTARRAAAVMLSATGDPDDAARAHAVFEALDSDRPRFSWPVDPNYSQVDPCDPGTQAPPNIDTIAATNKNIDVAVLSTGRGMTIEDHMVSRSMPALARFEPATAIQLRRKFARQALERTDVLPLRQAMMVLLKDSAILEPDAVSRLVSIGSSPEFEFLSDKGGVRDEWLVQQYALRAAFPHKSGDEQLRTLEAGGSQEALLDLLESTVPAGEAEVDAALERASSSGESNRLATVLSFVQFSGTPISSAVKSRLGVAQDVAQISLRMAASASKSSD